MKKFLNYLLIITFGLSVIISCKSDEDPNTDDQSTNTESIVAKRYEIVKISIPTVLKDEDYSIVLNDQTIIGTSAIDGEVNFIVPGDAKTGLGKLKISRLNYEANINIENLALPNTPDAIIADYITLLYNANALSTTTTTSQDIKHNIDNFKEIFNKSNSEEKLQIASLYQANQSLFNSIAMIKVPEPKGIMMDDVEKAAAIRISAISALNSGLVIGAIMLKTPNHLAKLKFSLAFTSGVAIGTSIILNDLFITISTRAIDSFIQLPQAEVSFVSDKNKSLSYSFTKRGVIKDDQNINPTNTVSLFFNDIASIFSINDKFNNAILWLNENIPLCNLKTITFNIVPTSSPSKTVNADAKAFERSTFSVNNSNVEIVSIKFNSLGKIDARLKIKNESITEPITTTLTANYKDDFNNYSKNIPIKVEPDNGFKLEGNWKLTYIEDGPADEWIIDHGTECPRQTEDHNYSGTTTFTSNSMTMNISEKYRYYKYNENCQLIDYNEPTGWQTITANHNNNIINNKLSLTNGKGISDDNYSWSFNNGVITVIDNNTLALYYSFHDGIELVELNYKMIRQ